MSSEETIQRCPWGEVKDKTVQEYHDHEWGKLNLNDQYLYEMLVLELFQSGLSWSTILHKRENFRKAFKGFDVEKVAQMNNHDVESLMLDKGIIRNHLKINAAIKNARAVLAIKEKYGSFAKYLQSFIPTQIVHHLETIDDVPASNDISKKISKQMKKDGFFFVGPVIIYSYLQGIGLINDHLDRCSFKYHAWKSEDSRLRFIFIQIRKLKIKPASYGSNQKSSQ